LISVNTIFHYYLIQFLALRSHFSPTEAYVLAYSSAYVDHNMVPEKIQIAGKSGYYVTIPTHHLGFWDPSQELTVWKPFHFFPGGADRNVKRPLLPGYFRDSFQWVTLADSSPVKELLIEALKTRNLYRIGIALHTFADSWAHQYFIGMEHKDNIVVKNSPIPPVGHAQAGRNPDRLQIVWDDPRRLESHIENWQVFRQAAKKIYRYLCTYQQKNFHDEEIVLDEFESIISNSKKNDHWDKEINKSYSLGSLAQKASKYLLNEITITQSKNYTYKTDDQIALDLRIYLNTLPYNRHDWKGIALGMSSVHHEEQFLDNKKDLYFWLKHEIRQQAQFDSLPVKKAPFHFESSDYYQWMEGAKQHLKASQTVFSQI